MKGLGRGWSDEAVEGALMALAAAGAVRILKGEDGLGRGGESRGPLTLGVHRGPMDSERARRLRRAALGKLAVVDRYARTDACRRRVLLGYFGEANAPERCGGCDRCLGGDDPLLGELGQSGFRMGGLGAFRALLGRWGIG